MRKLLSIAAMTLLAAGCHSDDVMAPIQPQPQPATVQLEPDHDRYRVGEKVTLRVVISNAENVGSVPFHLSYDTGVVQFERAVQGSFMLSDGANTVFLVSEISGGGEIVVGHSRLGSPQGISGEGTLMKLHFRAVATGACDFRFSGAGVKDPQALDLPATFNTVALEILP